MCLTSSLSFCYHFKTLLSQWLNYVWFCSSVAGGGQAGVGLVPVGRRTVSERSQTSPETLFTITVREGVSDSLDRQTANGLVSTVVETAVSAFTRSRFRAEQLHLLHLTGKSPARDANRISDLCHAPLYMTSRRVRHRVITTFKVKYTYMGPG